ncbi:hypothetical protein IJS77_00175 [bacterium]|nr:hypothetical protein [bacterium]
MKIAYIMSVYKDFDYLARILKMLKEPWADFYVHIDKKSKINIKKFQKENKLENVNFIKRMNVFWGGFTQIQSTIKLFKAVRNSGKKYDRIIFITDGEFPYWSNQKIYDFFSAEENKDKEFIAIAIGNEKKEGFESAESRVNIYTFFDWPFLKFFNRESVINRMWLFKHLQRAFGFYRKLLPIKYYRGNSKFYITQELMEYFLDYIELNPKDFKSFKHANCADEVIFPTLFMNSKYKDRLCNALYRYNIWGDHAPIVLDISHKDKIIKKKPFIVAKLNQGYSDELFEFLENNRYEE